MVLGILTGTCKKMKLDDLLTPYTRIKSKWIKDLNVRLSTIKILEENIGSKISDISCSNIFLWYITSCKGSKRKNKWDYTKQESFCTAKGTIHKVEREPTEWESIFTDTSDKGLTSKIYKELKKLNTKETYNPIKNGQRIWIDTSPRIYRWPIDIWKDAQSH